MSGDELRAVLRATKRSARRKKVEAILKDFEPRCGHPGCDAMCVAAPIVQDDSGHVNFCCSDMGHWVGTEEEVRWKLRV